MKSVGRVQPKKTISKTKKKVKLIPMKKQAIRRTPEKSVFITPGQNSGRTLGKTPGQTPGRISGQTPGMKIAKAPDSIEPEKRVTFGVDVHGVWIDSSGATTRRRVIKGHSRINTSNRGRDGGSASKKLDSNRFGRKRQKITTEADEQETYVADREVAYGGTFHEYLRNLINVFLYIHEIRCGVGKVIIDQ